MLQAVSIDEQKRKLCQFLVQFLCPRAIMITILIKLAPILERAGVFANCMYFYRESDNLLLFLEIDSLNDVFIGLTTSNPCIYFAHFIPTANNFSHRLRRFIQSHAGGLLFFIQNIQSLLARATSAATRSRDRDIFPRISSAPRLARFLGETLIPRKLRGWD